MQHGPISETQWQDSEAHLWPIPIFARTDTGFMGEVITVDGTPLPKKARAVAFGLDDASLTTLQAALTEWEIEVVQGATAASLLLDLSPEAADFLVVSADEEESAALKLCRGLRNQAGRGLLPMLVLVPPGKDSLVRAALKAGAHGCLLLPVQAQEVVGMLARARQGNRPGRHTSNLDRAQIDNPAQDCGGEA